MEIAMLLVDDVDVGVAETELLLDAVEEIIEEIELDVGASVAVPFQFPKSLSFNTEESL
jgi:hypothetical protein